MKFRFKTRTRSVNGDYRVFGEGGKNIYPESEFKPIADKTDRQDDPYVALYEEDGLIYVAAFDMKRGTKDFANRPIVFSFYQVFEDFGSAWAAFSRMILEWSEAETKMRSLIKETPKKEGRGENIEFQQEAFMAWLQEKRGRIVNYSLLKNGDVVKLSSIKSGIAFRPKSWCTLKWDENGGEIYCFRSNREKSSGNVLIGRSKGDIKNGHSSSNYGGKDFTVHKGKGWKLVAGFIIVLSLIGSGVGINKVLMKNAEAKARNTINANNSRNAEVSNKIKLISRDIAENKKSLLEALEGAKESIGTNEFATFIKRMEKFNDEIIKAQTRLENLQSQNHKNKNSNEQLLASIDNNFSKKRETIEAGLLTTSRDIYDTEQSADELQDTVKALGM